MAHVSVVVPAHNPGIYLRSAIESVIAQTFTDWDLVVVDDGSNEDLSYVKDTDSRVRLIKQKNRGVSIARNVGIRESSGDLVAFLDADDLWMPTKLASQVAMMDSRLQVGLCHTNFHIVDAKLRLICKGYGERATNYRELLKGCGILNSSVMVRRTSVFDAGLFDPMMFFAQDYDLWLIIACFYEIARVPTVETLYRWHGHNRSRNYRVTSGISADILRKYPLCAFAR